MWMDIGFTRNCDYVFQLYLDDCDRLSYLDVLPNKSEALPRWIDLKNRTENDSAPYAYAIIATDSEPLYWTPEWKQHTKDAGLLHEFSSRHRHDMLGVPERAMQAVGECFRSMMIFSSCPERDIPDALRYANVIRNNSPTSANNGWSPREKRAGRRLPPDKNLMRGPFGCLIFAHVYTEERAKHGDRGVACIFLGYDQNNNTFLVREISSGRRYYTADATFHPSVMPHRGGDLTNFDHLAPFLTQSSLRIDAVPAVGPRGAPAQHGAAPSVADRPARQRILSNQALRNLPDVGVPPNHDYPPPHLANITLHNFGPDPESMKEAMQMYDAEDWVIAELKEKNSFKYHEVYELVHRDQARGQRIFKPRAVYKRKLNPPDELNPNGSLDKHKVRMTIAAFTKMLKQGIDYEEKRSNTVRWAAQLILIAIAVQFDYDITLVDIETFFLYGELSKPVYMEIPEGWEEEGKPREDFVCKVKKSMYGHPAAAHCAQTALRHALDGEFHSTAADDCVFVASKPESGYAAVGAHVDDLLTAGDAAGTKKLIDTVGKKFKYTVRTNPTELTGVQVHRVRVKKWLKLHQTAYITDLLSRYQMLDSFPTDTPMDQGTATALMKLPVEEATPASIKKYQTLMGELIWLLRSRRDMHFTIGLSSRFTTCATPEHFKLMAGRPLRYLNGTRDYGIVFAPGNGIWELEAFTDSDFAGDINTSRSTTGYVTKIGAYGNLSCSSSREKKISNSTTQAETYAHVSGCKEVVWDRLLLRELNFPMLRPTPVKVDNDGVVKQSAKAINHASAKHYRVSQAYIRHLNDNQTVKTTEVNTKYNDADFLTKALPAAAFQRHRLAVMGPQEPPSSI
jgi:hypothetical protein